MQSAGSFASFPAAGGVKLTDAAPARKGMPPWPAAMAGPAARAEHTAATDAKQIVAGPTLRMAKAYPACRTFAAIYSVE